MCTDVCITEKSYFNTCKTAKLDLTTVYYHKQYDAII